MLEIDLGGRVAVVTGASSGIGARTAEVLAQAGAHVVAAGRDEGRLGETVASIEQAGGRAEAVAADLRDAGAIAAITEAAVGVGDQVDILAMPAGQFARTPFPETTAEEIDELWAVHVLAPFLLTQALLPHLADGGSVLFYSSTVVQTGFAPYAGYSAVKGAVESLARALAVELAPRIRVNIITPGFTATPMVTGQFPDAPGLEEAIIARTPVGFLGDADSAAHVAAYLCSDQARYIDGARFVVDGGWLAQGWQAAQ